MGATKVADVLPGLVEAVQRAGRTVLWVCDPMHGNTQVAPSGVKTRDFDDILREVELTFDVHEGCGTHLGGVHFEMTGEDVTECIGGAAGVTVDDLDKNYASACDPRLNYRQTLEMGFRIAQRLGSTPHPSLTRRSVADVFRERKGPRPERPLGHFGAGPWLRSRSSAARTAREAPRNGR
jgi:3-deoxy-7-phosphoheptulonate synthase